MHYLKPAAILFAFGILFLCSACSMQKGDKSTPGDSTAIRTDVVSDSSQTAAAYHGPRLNVEEYFILTSADSVLTPPVVTEKEEDEILNLQSNPKVRRSQDTLAFSLKNGKQMILVNNPNGEEDFASYVFLRNLDDIGQWEVRGLYYESWDYILIDQENGREMHIWGHPVMSPDKKYFLTGMVDLEAGFVYNGFQLFTIQNGVPVNLWEREVENWGSDNFQWVDRNTIIAEQTYRDTATSELRTRLIKLKMHWPKAD